MATTCVCQSCAAEVSIPSQYERYKETIKRCASKWYYAHRHEEAFKEGARRRAKEYYYQKKARLAAEALANANPKNVEAS